MAEKAIGELAIFYGDKLNSGMYDNGVWMDLLDIPWITKLEEASLYKTVIHTMWLEATGWHKEIRNRYPHVKLIGLSDHPLSTHISRLPAGKQHAYLQDLQYLDGIMALTEEERQWYQVAVPSIPVERVGLPFPTENYEKLYGKFRSQERDIIGLGVGAADNDRNFVSNVLAFNKLQLSNPDLVGVFLSVPDQLLPYCSFWADRMDNVFIQQRNGMDDFYEMLSRCKFVISLADRNTPGRIQGEAAFFDIPVIGSDRAELQRELFPSFAVSPYAIEQVVDHGQWILDNPEAAKELASEGHYRLVTEYNYEQSRARFNNLLARIGGEVIDRPRVYQSVN
jgi:glycosyltransferase involved in cell wall biosynthesis